MLLVGMSHHACTTAQQSGGCILIYLVSPQHHLDNDLHCTTMTEHEHDRTEDKKESGGFFSGIGNKVRPTPTAQLCIDEA